MTILLDAGPLGMVSNPKASRRNRDCYEWLLSAVADGARVLLPEIADYEVRRELLRANKAKGLERLDLLKQTLEYLPLSTGIMLRAAQLWADARRSGLPTADRHALDCDVILASQALEVGGEVVTDNVGHLSRFVEARLWQP
jgi:predicted nucleic acid-binding protein